MRSRHLFAFAAAALVISTAGLSPVRAQSASDELRIGRSDFTIRVGRGQPQEIQGPYFHVGGSPVVRIWQDYVLGSDRHVRGVVVVGGDATIDGYVDGDVVVTLGNARLGRTAVIEGSLIVIGGDVTIADGGKVHRELVLVGGSMSAPPGFTPGSEYFILGAPWLGEQMRAVVPWVTRGLLLGRPLVPELGWMWTLVALVLIVSLAINLLLHGAVSKCADALGHRPLSAFFAGLLVMLLTAPVAVLLTATVVGILIVPFLFCGVVVAWFVGRVAVARWIGRRVGGQIENESVGEGLRSFLIGFVLLVLLYMVPIIGFVVWAMVGVFGLGAATLALLGGLRRERPTAPAPTPVVPPPTEPPVAPPPTTPVSSTPPSAPLPSPHIAMSALGGEAVAAMPPFMAADVTMDAPAVSADGTDLRTLPRATFLDRSAAFVLDILLVVIFEDFTNVVHSGQEGVLLLLVYFVGFWAWKGTTIGGIICNLRVVRVDGAPLRFVDALVRALSSIFSFAALGLGVLWILRDPQGQAWHDKIAGTYVVKVPRSWPVP